MSFLTTGSSFRTLLTHLRWHIFTLLSVTGTLAILSLNISRYDVGGEIGFSSKSSADVIGILQLVTKLHELLIIASLGNIAHSLVVGQLMSDGIVLGLLGAETAFAAPSFVVSADYLRALRVGWRGVLARDMAQRRVFWLSLFLFWACVISSLAGPSSAVLLIPRIGWSLFSTRRYTPDTAGNIVPHIMISAADTSTDNLWAMSPSAFQGLEYWDLFFRNSAWNSTHNEHFEHEFPDDGSKIYMNVTGSYDRLLDGTWDGGTVITSYMRPRFYDSEVHTRMMVDVDGAARGWQTLKTTIDVNALVARMTCRDRTKIPCDNGTATAEWCYISVHEFTASPKSLRSSSNLILAADYGDAESQVWITDGPRIAANPYYSDTLEIVFEGRHNVNGPYPPFDLSVCSFSATLVSGIGSTTGNHTTPNSITYLPYITLSNGTTTPPRQLLFHSTWLDFAYSAPAPTTATPFSYPSRPHTTPPGPNLLAMFGNTTRNAGSRGNKLGNHTLAAALEGTVGGALTFLLSWLPPTSSQYAIPPELIPARYTAGLPTTPPDALLTGYVFRAYRQGYIYRLETRTGYLGLVILVLHAVTAVTGSVWKVMTRRRVVLGWMDTPDYTMLGAGSEELEEGVGIKGVRECVVVLQRRVAGPPRLELVAKGYADGIRTRGLVSGDERERYM